MDQKPRIELFKATSISRGSSRKPHKGPTASRTPELGRSEKRTETIDETVHVREHLSASRASRLLRCH
jgi:hypothetical protein